MSKTFTGMAGVRSVERALRPKSIAIVGASADPRAFGNFVLQNLERFGYAGEIHLVSRSSTQINGRACVSSVDALPQGIDLAVLCIPEAGVLDTVRTLGTLGAGAAVIFASGYAEAGEAGRVKQDELARVAAAGGVALIGPNCMGFTNFADGVPVTFEAVAPYSNGGRRGVGVVAQSGAMAANLRDAFMGRGQPLTATVSTGNEANLGIEDYLAWFIADPQTSAIAIYAEQIRRPQLFLQLARDARAAGKPIVMLMPGKSARAREAAQSHTGALAGDHATASVLLAREGVVVVASLDELFDTATILARFPVPPAAGTAVMTASGAVKNITLDFADDIGLTLPPLTEATIAKLTELLPDYAVADNPLDYTTIGVRNPGLIGELIDTVLADPNIGSLVLSIMAGPAIAQRDKADHLVPALARATKPAVLTVMGDDKPLEEFFSEAIAASGVPLFRSPDRALRACARVAAYGEALARAERARTDQPAALPLPGAVPANGIFAEYQGKGWLARAGLPVPAGDLARSLDDALTIAQQIGYPVVLKAQASELPHKSDVGGVVVGLADAAALRAGWDKLHTSVAAQRPDLQLDGVLVETMGPRGLELVVGAKRDADWGPVVLVGLGGIFIEVLKDVRLLPADLAEQDIVVELNRLKAAAMLHGVRGSAAVDVHAVARAVAAIGEQMRANPALTEIDVNPLVAYPDRVLALDALVVCGAHGSAHGPAHH
ncbi:acetate--CoA ligase family protein [Paraburkholderia sp. MMS20-SJTR3]|uniref:Acetate--CoA ligase family protein n=1 Tax=Paraburkholderia sejongensis TaxID=2886946 RepID=A0ABS8K1R2_9BURK|nr:acetate--CoA ligase family protein [Paraburkholderia sp. MMS20-SJTR3]MCC8395844.1 acetate--CoA ligase family protein [Paraburkholderia sp. MMS20-SJTR3]